MVIIAENGTVFVGLGISAEFINCVADRAVGKSHGPSCESQGPSHESQVVSSCRGRVSSPRE